MIDTNQSPEIDSVIRKIQKMFAMASDNHSQAEAELMMARAQELLAKYNLDATMVTEANVAGGTVAAAPEKRTKTRMTRSAQYQWQRDMWREISEANFCWHSVIEVYAAKRSAGGEEGKTSKKPVKRHLVLGKESNVMAVRIMGEYLEDTMERLLPYPNAERLSRAAINWKAGCAERLCERIREQAEQRKMEGEAAKSASAGSTAMVLRDVYQAEYAGNYDFRNGDEAYARKLLQDAEWEQGQEERNKRAQEYREQKEREYLAFLANESPADKKKREKAEAAQRLKDERANDRYSRTWHNERYREMVKRDPDARRAGREKADSIGLASQVGSQRKDRTLE